MDKLTKREEYEFELVYQFFELGRPSDYYGFDVNFKRNVVIKFKNHAPELYKYRASSLSPYSVELYKKVMKVHREICSITCECGNLKSYIEGTCGCEISTRGQVFSFWRRVQSIIHFQWQRILNSIRRR